jgi:hypothetical protein
MNDLTTLLDRAAGDTPAIDADADLRRGRHALSRTRRRRSAIGLAGVAAAGVVGVTASRNLGSDDGPTAAVESADSGAADRISFLAQPLEAGPYTFDTTPEGWEVQGADDSSVTIAPVGFADQDPTSFVGKLTILFDANPLFGKQVEQDGRTFWVNTSNPGTTVVATPSLPGEPTGHVLIQVPDSAGWDQDAMLTFLGSVHVGPGAQAGVG